MNILLVEDSAADAYLTKLALKEALPDASVCVVENGEQALQYLAVAEHPSSVVPPDLILLDLHIPRLDGFSLLTYLKAYPEYQETSVIILTTSNCIQDINRAYQLGALRYFIKPASWQEHMMLGFAIAVVWNQWRAHLTSTASQSSY